MVVLVGDKVQTCTLRREVLNMYTLEQYTGCRAWSIKLFGTTCQKKIKCLHKQEISGSCAVS